MRVVQVMGAVNWALNSIWTGAPAWGSISHDGSWKMLHYRLRHVFDDLLLSFVYPPLPPAPSPPTPSPAPAPRSDCVWTMGTDYSPGEGTGALGSRTATTKEECCAQCWAEGLSCAAGVFSANKTAKKRAQCADTGVECCWLKTEEEVAHPAAVPGVLSCAPKRNRGQNQNQSQSQSWTAAGWSSSGYYRYASASASATGDTDTGVHHHHGARTGNVTTGGGAPPAISSCPPGHACLHLSNHKLEPLEALSCALEVRAFATGRIEHSVNFTSSVSANSGADVFSIGVAALMEAAAGDPRGTGACANLSKCFLTALCSDAVVAGGGSGGIPRTLDASTHAQPYFPVPLSQAELLPVGLTVTVVTVAIASEAAASSSSMRDYRYPYPNSYPGTNDNNTSSVPALSVEVATNTTAPFTFLSSSIQGVFSDNSFMLLPEKPTTVTFQPAYPTTAQQFEKALKIYVMNQKLPISVGV